jgi:hypothetical protein
MTVEGEAGSGEGWFSTHVQRTKFNFYTNSPTLAQQGCNNYNVELNVSDPLLCVWFD